VKVTPLDIEGAWLIETPTYPDARGLFREWFVDDLNDKFGLPFFQVIQANTSISAKGVIRGLHYSNSQNGQSKIVTCTSGSGLDVIVDLRIKSKTFGEFVTVELSYESGLSVFVSSGLAHGFQAYEDKTSLTYLLNKKYDPQSEFSINPLDVDLAINWRQIPVIMSERDRTSGNFLEIKSGIKNV